MATRNEPSDILLLTKQRGIVKSQFTRTLNVLKSKEFTNSEIQARLKLAEECWQKFVKIQEQIEYATPEEDGTLQKELDYRYEVEDIYLKIVDMLNPSVNQSVVPQAARSTSGSFTTSDEDVIPHVNFTPYSINETFSNFVKILNNYFFLKKITSPKTKVYMLLNTLSPELHQTLCDIVAPEQPVDKTFDELVKFLKDSIDPTPSTLANQHKFINRTQQQCETVSDYARELKRLTVHCEFNCDYCNKSIVDMFLKMQFIRGLKDNDIRISLLQNKDNKQKFSTIVDTASSIEQSKLESCEINVQGLLTQREDCFRFDHVSKENKAQSNVDNKSKGAPTTFEDLKGKCYRCGSAKHKAPGCKFKDEICRKCNKIGHISNVCLSKNLSIREMSGRKLNYVDHTYHDENEVHEIHKITSAEQDKFMVKVSIEGISIDMELDTGAALTSISFSDYKKMNLKNEIFRTAIEMRTYTGEIIKPLGMCFVKCKYRDYNFHGKLYVLHQEVEPIFGREWLREIKMNWADIKLVEIRNKGQLDSLLQEFKVVFESEIGEITTEKGHLRLKDGVKPIYIKPRQVPYALKKPVEDELKRLENTGVITKIDHSEWGTPIVPVRKPNGTVRLCADYKVTANKLILEENYPIPRIEDIYAQMNKGKYFCTLDISNAYLHLPMDDDSALIQTLSTHLGLYKVNRLMFGIKVAPSIWQRFMDKVLYGLPGTLCFFDDIIIQGSTYDETLARLREVLSRIKQHHLRLNRDKCQFFQTSVKYLGHIIDENGLHKSKENTEAIIKTTRPKNINELRTFLGLANYYNRFIPNLSTILYPLNNLLQKGEVFRWTKECEDSFARVKAEITSDTVLTHYDPNVTLTLATDASPFGLGACLSHKYEDGTERPIAYASRSLTKTERKYSQIDKEAVSIYWGLKKFFVYCYGRKFVLITDHKPLVSIFDPSKNLPSMTASRMFNYAHFLSGFDYEIKYRSTICHGNADYLSRFPTSTVPDVWDDHEEYMTHQIDTMPVIRKEIKRETAQDPELRRVLQNLMTGKSLADFGLKDGEYSIQDGCIFRGTRIVIPTSLQKQVLNELHAGHFGMTKMKLLARSFCYWKNIDSDIEKLVKTCSPCQQKLNYPPRERIHPWEPASEPWQRVHIDFAGPLKGWWYLIVVDAYTKWVEIIPTKTITTAWCLNHLEKLFITFGLPYVLVSDNGKQFTSRPFKFFLDSRAIIHKTIAPFHPASNGQAERVVQTVKQHIHASGTGDNNEKINTILKQLRRTHHATTGVTPYQLMFGRNIRTELSLLSEMPFEALKKNERTNRQLDVGQAVLARNYSTTTSDKWMCGKVEKRLGNVMYLLTMEDGNKYKRHIDQIRKL